jgi:hypothetical protein
MTNQRAIMVHSIPTDILLNTACMQDAIHMEYLCFPIDHNSIRLNEAILEGSAFEIDLRKTATTLRVTRTTNSATSVGHRSQNHHGPQGWRKSHS